MKFVIDVIVQLNIFIIMAATFILLQMLDLKQLRILTQASVHYLEAVREIFLTLENKTIYADSELQSLVKANETYILTPYKIKRLKNN